MVWVFENDQPIYTQLVDQIKFAIVSGELPPGARMPAVRELSLEAGVNPNTMQRALQQLEREGLVYAQRSAGRFVTEDMAVITRVREALAAEKVRRFRDAMRALGCGEEEMRTLLFGSGEEQNGNMS